MVVPMRKKELSATTSPDIGDVAPPDPRDFNLHKVAYSINDLLEIGPDKRTNLYAAIKAGKLRVHKHGKNTITFAPDYAAYLAGIPEWQPAGTPRRGKRA